MRSQILKNKRGHSTKSERRFMEILKEFRISFRTKVKIEGREVDFLIEKDVWEIDGHQPDSEKNQMLLDAGYIPYHLYNWEVSQPPIKEWLKQKYASRSKFVGNSPNNR